jgi:hypothetical protein
MLEQLSGWQRVGVVLSMLWIAWGVWFYADQQSEHALRMAAIDQDLCFYEKQNDPARDCNNVWTSSYNRFYKVKGVDLALVALGPVLGGWLIAWLAFATFKRVRAGLRPQE